MTHQRTHHEVLLLRKSPDLDSSHGEDLRDERGSCSYEAILELNSQDFLQIQGEILVNGVGYDYRTPDICLRQMKLAKQRKLRDGCAFDVACLMITTGAGVGAGVL